MTGISGRAGKETRVVMIANVMLQRLFDIHKEFWSFDAASDPRTKELIARQQLRLIGDVSRIVSFIMIPVAIYMIVNLYIFASRPFLAAGLFGLAVVIFISARNFRRQKRQVFDIRYFDAAISLLCVESVIVALAVTLSIAFPLAFGQIPFNENSVILALGSIIIGGFTYGSIPRAQTYAIAIPTVTLSISFLVIKGASGIQSVSLLFFFAVAIDSIYRLFFFNFAKRHIYAAEQKEAAETVKLLLNDYAEQSSDWLWETDTDKRIVRASNRFATAAGLPIGDLNGTHIVDLFSEGEARQTLLRLIGEGKPIRDLVLPISVAGEDRWWRISCRVMCALDGRSKALRGAATDITNEQRAKDQIARLAHYDSLTDLPNRSLFNESMERSLARLQGDQSLAVLYVDIDRFKAINDTMGHSAGDRVLQAVGHRLAAAIGTGDIAARLSGDEFAVCLSCIENSEDLADIAAAIIGQVSEPLKVDGHNIALGISIGIAVTTDQSDSAEDLLQRADIALYRSKENGRGRVTIFEPHMLQSLQDWRSMELDLQSALKRREFELLYQPLIDIETEQPIGYEALVRWNHPTRGVIMPDEFIPVAEATGIIIPLGEWVIRSALHEARNWPDHLSVAVNLSPTQMRSPNLLPTIIHGLASAGIETDRLELEITETVIMSNNESNFDLLNKIHSLGVKIALDDFGTGYSSLNYLRSFPFDKIKIDRCFVEEVVSREDCQAIIRAVAGLATSLGMVTTAEGIECEEQLAQVKRAGCKLVQGHLFSRAIPAHEIAGRVVKSRPELADMDPMPESETTLDYTRRRIG
ncbi:MAG: diguanylate cyclase (GGDEF)-like protein [Parasphingorhabdus sp.]|jgi:diguanylate cyclase (GGDEF)-like protein